MAALLIFLLAWLCFSVGLSVGALLNITSTRKVKDQAFFEGRNDALANAAMTAYDLGHHDVAVAINRLVSDQPMSVE